MRTLIVYDSLYGNTAEIAQAIGRALSGEVLLHRAGAEGAGEDLAALGEIDLLIVGAPTQGGRPIESVRAWLDQLPAGALQGVRVAAFDTRLSSKLVRIFGYAAPKIVATLKGKGGTPVGSEGAFLVKGRRGPLLPGELERAAAWAQEVAAAAR